MFTRDVGANDFNPTHPAGARVRLLALALVGGFLFHAWLLAGLAEDAFITFRYARHLALGHGLVWNVGSPPVEGYTNFLWLLLSAGIQALGLDPLRGAQLAGVAASVAALFTVHRAGTQLLGWTPLFALLPCAFLALSGPFATWAAAGLETNLFGTLVLVGVFHLARHVRDGGRGDAWAACLALFAATLTRPEGLLVAVVAFAAAHAQERPAQRRWLLAAPEGLFLVLLCAYTAWRLATFGHWLPNTFHAKTGGGLAQAERGLYYARFFLWHYGAPWLVVLAVAALPTRRGAALAGGAGDARLARWRRASPLLVQCGAVSAAWLGYVVAVGGDYMAMYRFFAPVLPLLTLLLGAATHRALRTSALSPGPRRALVAAGLTLAALGTLVHSTPLERDLFRVPPRLHGNWRGVETERWHVSRLATIGRFFRDYAAPGESLATDAIGAVGWYSDMEVWGAHGLVDPLLARRPQGDERVGRGVAGHGRRDLAFVVATRAPTFVMLGRELVATKPVRAKLPSDVAQAAGGRYRLVSVWLEDPGNAESGWFGFLERRDRAAPGAR